MMSPNEGVLISMSVALLREALATNRIAYPAETKVKRALSYLEAVHSEDRTMKSVSRELGVNVYD
jgi:hypothetical protein